MKHVHNRPKPRQAWNFHLEKKKKGGGGGGEEGLYGLIYASGKEIYQSC